MKTAISIPDSIFNQAENLAQKLGISLNELYALAMSDYLKNHERKKDITEKLNQVYSQQNSQLDETISTMQFLSLTEGEW